MPASQEWGSITTMKRWCATNRTTSVSERRNGSEETMKRFDTRSTLFIVSILLALGAAGFAVTRFRSVRTASQPGNSEMARLRVRSLCEDGYRYRAAGNYEEAGPPLREALAVAEETFGRDDVEVASVFNQIGMLDKYAGNFDKGEQVYR